MSEQGSRLGEEPWSSNETPQPSKGPGGGAEGGGAGAPKATQNALAGFNPVFYWHSHAGPSSAKAGSFKHSEAQAPFPEILI